jgi:P4 family phage/plasmid primase-like protien
LKPKKKSKKGRKRRAITAQERKALRRGREIRDRLWKWLGGPAVLSPIHPRSKAAAFRSHQSFTLPLMRRRDFLIALGRPDRNVGVLLGERSNGLVSLDFDRQENADAFLELNPSFRETLTTTASRGCNLWFRIDGEIPESFDLKDPAGENRVEFRANKRQTIIEGIHPSGCRYQVINDKPPIKIRYEDIVWPQGWRDDESAGQMQTDEYEELVRKHGPPVLVSNERVLINEVSLAKRLLLTRPIAHMRGTGFEKYEASNGQWKTCTTDWVKTELAVDLAQIADELELPRLKFMRTNRRLGDIAALVAAHGEIDRSSKKPPTLIHLANGMLDLNSEPPKLLPFSPDYFSHNVVPIQYDPSAACPQFLLFLHEALDEIDITLVQKWAGLVLSGSNFAQAILLLIGVAKAGKGTFMDIITRIIGTENCEQLRTGHLLSRFEYARYVSKTLLIGADVRGDFLNLVGAQALKSLTGGDFLTAELKGQNVGVPLKGNFNVGIVSNRRLRLALDGDDDAWARRLKIVEFRRRAEWQDPTLADRIVKLESSGILNWMLEGLIALRHDFQESGKWLLENEQQARIDNLIWESNSLRAFVTDEVLVGESSDSVTVSEMRLAYERFCSERGWVPQSKSVVERELPNIIVDLFQVRKRHDIQRDHLLQRGWSGIKLAQQVVIEEGYVSDVF